MWIQRRLKTWRLCPYQLYFSLPYSVFDNISVVCLTDVIFERFLCRSVEISKPSFDLGWKKTLRMSISWEILIWVLLSFSKLENCWIFSSGISSSVSLGRRLNKNCSNVVYTLPSLSEMYLELKSLEIIQFFLLCIVSWSYRAIHPVLFSGLFVFLQVLQEESSSGTINTPWKMLLFWIEHYPSLLLKSTLWIHNFKTL